MFRDKPRCSRPCLSGEEGVCAVSEARGLCLSPVNVIAALTMLLNYGEEFFSFLLERETVFFNETEYTFISSCTSTSPYHPPPRDTAARVALKRGVEDQKNEEREKTQKHIFYKLFKEMYTNMLIWYYVFFRRITRRGYLCCLPQHPRAEGPPRCTA